MKGIVASPPQEVPEQLLKALEKDAKNLQKSFGSVREAMTSWLLNLCTAAETAKVLISYSWAVKSLNVLLPKPSKPQNQFLICGPNVY